MVSRVSPSRILFVYNTTSGFTAIDRDLLKERWQVDEWFQRRRYVNLPALLAAIRQCDLVFGWFASWHTLWPMTIARLVQKPSVLVIGGYDTANLPDIGYGLQMGGLKRWISRLTVRQTQYLTTYSQYCLQEITTNMGVRAHRLKLIPLGIPDPFAENLDLTQHRDQVALTVGNVSQINLKRKGLETFVQTAAHLPQFRFVMGGRWEDSAVDQLRQIAGENVIFTGWLTNEDLIDHYRRSAVYVQASYHEGFGMSVAEAMLGGCIPVVTRVGALPEVVDDTGIFTTHDHHSIAAAIQEAATAGHAARQRARERILGHFPLAVRREGLHKIIEQALEKR